MKPAARSRGKAGRMPAGNRNPFRFRARLSGRLSKHWRDLNAGRGLRMVLALERGERILTIARDPAGACTLVATERALYHRGDGNDWLRQGWERVSAVDWDAEGRRLVLSSLTSAGLGTQRSVLALGHCDGLVELAGERITHTRLGRWPLMLSGGEAATVEARRRPVTGELLWLVHLDGICWDIRDRAVHAGITTVIARLSTDLGIPVQEPG